MKTILTLALLCVLPSCATEPQPLQEPDYETEESEPNSCQENDQFALSWIEQGGFTLVNIPPQNCFEQGFGLDGDGPSGLAVLVEANDQGYGNIDPMIVNAMNRTQQDYEQLGWDVIRVRNPSYPGALAEQIHQRYPSGYPGVTDIMIHGHGRVEAEGEYAGRHVLAGHQKGEGNIGRVQALPTGALIESAIRGVNPSLRRSSVQPNVIVSSCQSGAVCGELKRRGVGRYIDGFVASSRPEELSWQSANREDLQSSWMFMRRDPGMYDQNGDGRVDFKEFGQAAYTPGATVPELTSVLIPTQTPNRYIQEQSFAPLFPNAERTDAPNILVNGPYDRVYEYANNYYSQNPVIFGDQISGSQYDREAFEAESLRDPFQGYIGGTGSLGGWQ